MTLDLGAGSDPSQAPPQQHALWRARFCARFQGVCGLLRLAHHSRVPF